MLAGLSASGAHGTLIQIVDPAEESFPYSGRVEFVEPEGGGVITAGRAETLGQRLRRARGAASRPDPRRDRHSSTGCSRPTPPTARPPSCCCSCTQRHDGEQGQRAHRDRQSGAQRMIAGLPLGFRRTVAAAGPVEPAAVVVAVAGDAAAAAAHRVPADAAVVRHRAEGRNPVAHAVVADRAAPARRRADHPGRRRTDSGIRRLASPAARAPLVILLDDGWSAAASWDIRIKAADELIAQRRQRPPRRRAGAAVGAARATSRSMPAGTARVRVAPARRRNPIRSSGSKRCPRSRVSSKRPATAKSPGCRMASIPDAGRNFVEGLAQDHRRSHD